MTVVLSGILAILVVGALVAAIVGTAATRRWWPLLLIAGLVVGLGATLMTARPEMVVELATVQNDVRTSDWDLSAEILDSADRYSSVDTATTALARRFANRMGKLLPPPTEAPSAILVRFESATIKPIAEAFRRALQEQIPSASLALVNTEGERTMQNDEIRIALSFSGYHRLVTTWEQSSGLLQITARTSSGSFTDSVQLEQKQWLEPGVNLRRFGNQWIVGQSSQCASRAEALERARSQAASQTIQILQARGVSFAQFSDPNQLHDHVAQRLEDYNLIEDQFIQSFRRDYGTFWHAAVLVNVTPGRMYPLQNELPRGGVRTRNTWAAIIGLGAVVVLLYFVLNAVTKHYYRGSLGILAVIGFFALAVVAAMLA